MALCLLGAKSAGLSSVGYFLATLDIGLRQIGPVGPFRAGRDIDFVRVIMSQFGMTHEEQG